MSTESCNLRPLELTSEERLTNKKNSLYLHCVGNNKKNISLELPR